jgi:hypothetical protein
MRITDKSQLIYGMGIFTVCGFGACGPLHHCSISEQEFLSFQPKKPTIISIKRIVYYRLLKTGKWETDKGGTGLWTKSDVSMKDAGIIPNTYNNHRTFDNLAEAKKYAEYFYGFFTSTKPLTSDADNDYDRAMKPLRK